MMLLASSIILRSKSLQKNSGNVMHVTPTTGKRNRDSLTANSRDIKYRGLSQSKKYFLDTKARMDSGEKAVWAHFHAKTAAQARWYLDKEIDRNLLFDDLGGLATQYAGIYTDQRLAIKYVYIAVLGAPPKESWHDMKLVPVVSHMLGIPTTSHKSVLATLTKIHEKVAEYDGSRKKGTRRLAFRASRCRAQRPW